MTVTSTERDPMATIEGNDATLVGCAWFDGAKAMKDHFDARVLVATE